MKHTTAKQRAIFRIKMDLLNGRLKEAIEKAEKSGIDSKEFGKILKQLGK